MKNMKTTTVWSNLSYKEKNNLLFHRQRKTLEMFLKRGAISRDQHDKSLNDLIERMGGIDNDANQVKA